jgi:Flp pilus assembly protein TadD
MTVQELFARGWQHHQADQYPQAEAAFRQVVQADPGRADAWALLAESCLFQGRFAEAETGYRQALRLAPGPAQSHANLGVALVQQGKLAEAAASYREALRLQPDHVDALSNLGAVLVDLEQEDEAVACLRQALQLAPGAVRALNNLGRALIEKEQFPEAEAHLRQALRLQPNYAKAHANLGVTLMKQGRHDEAVAHLQQAVRLEPGYADAHKNLAMVWLQQGNYAKGWPEYEWRWRCKEFTPPVYAQPAWDGGPLAGRTILLYAEQGLGDTLQFVRYAPLVQARGGRVVVHCQRPLLPLLLRCRGIDQVVPRGAPLPPFDVHAALLSLPLLFGTTLATVPADIPYLFADETLVASWRRELAALPGFKVGIAWQGSTGYGGDRERSTRLAYFEPLARLPGVRLLSLQKGYGSEQLAEAAGRFPVEDLGNRLDETSGAFMDTAAVMKCLDLVITVDTSLGHLAGGLGVPVWVTHPFAPDWRWQWGREDSPWYPTLRFFRQTEWGRWEPVFARMAEELRTQRAG